MASGLFRYNGKRINEKNLINNNFRGYSLYELSRRCALPLTPGL